VRQVLTASRALPAWAFVLIRSGRRCRDPLARPWLPDRLEHSAGLARCCNSPCAPGAGRAPVRAVLYRQLYFTGSQTLWRASLIGVPIGIVILAQVAIQEYAPAAIRSG
jgi:hypothetical protein